jgi:hypothetical protein
MFELCTQESEMLCFIRIFILLKDNTGQQDYDKRIKLKSQQQHEPKCSTKKDMETKKAMRHQ